MLDNAALKEAIRRAGRELGFAAVGVARAEVGAAAGELREWLAAGCHGEMDYMARHAELRANPQQLQPGTVTVISVAVDYLPLAKMADTPELAAISRYALGRDYHKVVRSRLQKLADAIAALIGPFGYRVFSAKSTATCPCYRIRPAKNIAAPAPPASTSARRRPSPRRIRSMPGAASPT